MKRQRHPEFLAPVRIIDSPRIRRNPASDQAGGGDQPIVYPFDILIVASWEVGSECGATNYTAIADWVPVFANREAVFINLQSKDYKGDLAMARRDLGVTVHNFEELDHYDDLDDVAALAAALDVAISVSTAVAAITAGVGTPT